jgi:hypothetical protein
MSRTNGSFRTQHPSTVAQTRSMKGHLPRHGALEQRLPLRETEVLARDEPQELGKCRFVGEVVARQDTCRRISMCLDPV